MKKWIWPALAALCLVMAIVAVSVTCERAEKAETALEEVYRAALYETVEEMQSLSLSLEKMLVSADPGQGTQLLSQISRGAQNVQRDLTFLPLSHEAMGPTLAFANQLSDYAQSLLPALTRQGALADADAAQLSAHHALCAQLAAQLVLAQREIEQTATAWTGSFRAPAEPVAHPLEALGDKDNGMQYPTLIYDGAFSDAKHLGRARGLPEETVTEAEALEAAREFVGADRALAVRSAPSTTGTVPAWGVTVETADVQLNLDITVQGGKVLWMMPESASFPAVQSVAACRDAAADFLRQRGFDAMEPTHQQAYDGLCVINFAAVQDGTLLYPDLVKVQVRMDTAEVVGLEANNYWMNHVPRSLPEPALTVDEARARLSPEVSPTASRLCVIPWHDTERLCYEFSVSHGDGEYLIYLDAATGSEVQILKLIPVEQGALTARKKQDNRPPFAYTNSERGAFA